MSDYIDDLVEYSLENKGRPTYKIDPCPNCKLDWHGTRRYNCPGSHNVLTDVQLAAIQSQSYMDIPDFDYGLGDE